MTKGTAVDDFVKEGLKRYADARDAVELFEQQVQARLRQALERYSWTNFRAADGSSSRLYDADIGRLGTRAIWVSQAHQDPNEGTVALGIWWHPPARSEDVVAYCARWNGKGRLQPSVLADPKSPVQVGALNHAGSRLYVILNDVDLDEVCTQLLSEMDRALGTATAR